MTNQQTSTSSQKAVPSSDNNFKSKVASLADTVKRSKMVKAAIYTMFAVSGILLFGGLFRVLAWTMLGWNQLMVACK